MIIFILKTLDLRYRRSHKFRNIYYRMYTDENCPGVKLINLREKYYEPTLGNTSLLWPSSNVHFEVIYTHLIQDSYLYIIWY